MKHASNVYMESVNSFQMSDIGTRGLNHGKMSRLLSQPDYVIAINSQISIEEGFISRLGNEDSDVWSSSYVSSNGNPEYDINFILIAAIIGSVG